jgi:3-methyl-2-oxobutanoate hydroxymethyltransferase
MAHMGLRPQSVRLVGGYRSQGRTAHEADQIVALAQKMEDAGAAALLLEAVPAQVAKAVVDAMRLPVIGCGAGPFCHGHVFVTQDALGLTPNPPRFVPALGDIATPLRSAYQEYVRQVVSGEYPQPEHEYSMKPEAMATFLQSQTNEGEGKPVATKLME